MGTVYSAAVGRPPDPRKRTFKQWAERLKDFRLAECPSSRSTTYYFAQAGDDTTGDGSIENPWRSAAKAHAVIDASSGDIACLFNRGDTWNESPTVTFGQSAANSTGMAMVRVQKNNVTIGAYGIGNKPKFDHPYSTYNSNWLLESGSTYERESANIGWLVRGDRDDPLRRQTSLTDCRATTNSFYTDGSDLFVNLGATDPDTLTLYGLTANNHTGFRVEGDGCRVEDVSGFGWGLNPSDTNSHHYFLSLAPTGTDSCVAYNVDATHGSAHVLASWNQGSGGIVSFINCEAGWSYPHSSSQLFNFFSQTAANENILWGCSATYGTLPRGTSANYSPEAYLFNGHTDGTGSVFCLAWNNTIQESSFGLGSDGSWGSNPTAASIADVRSYVFGTTMTNTQRGGIGTAISTSNMLRANCSYTIKPYNVQTQLLLNGDLHGWSWNNIFDIDLDLISNNSFSAGQGNHTINIWLSSFIIRNRGTGATSDNHGWLLDRSNYTPGSNNLSNLTNFRGNIYAADANSEGRVYIGSGSNSTVDFNAFYNIGTGSSGRLTTAVDANKVVLVSQPDLEEQPTTADDIYIAGPDDLGIEYDINWNARIPESPSMGAVEHPSILLTGLDLKNPAAKKDNELKQSLVNPNGKIKPALLDISGNLKPSLLDSNGNLKSSWLN